MAIANRTARRAQAWAIKAASPSSKSSVGWPSEISTSTGGSARASIGGLRSSAATSSSASPMAVTPAACRSTHCSCSTGVGVAMCQAARSAKRTARTNTRASGFSRATATIPGNDCRIAWLSAWILPSACIDPEQSHK